MKKGLFDVGIGSFSGFGVPSGSSSIRKRSLTPAQKLWAWENKSHVCHVCGKRVSKQSEADFDHVRAYSKGGATNPANVRICHRFCNSVKGGKSLSAAKKFLGVKSKPRKRTRSRRKKTPESGIFGQSIIKMPKNWP